MAKVSVIIPCYNQGIFIEQAIDSIIQQSYKDIEVVIVNDGSTDDFTIGKLKNLKNCIINLIEIENKGLASARNLGFKNSTGQFIQFLDADDLILPLKLDEQLEVFSKFPETDVCYSDYTIYDMCKNEYLPLQGKRFLTDDPLKDFLFRWDKDLSIPIHCALFKRNVWETDSPFNIELRAKEDWVMWCDLALRNKKFQFLDEEYAIYRYHGENMSKDINGMSYNALLATYFIAKTLPDDLRSDFLHSSIENVYQIMKTNLYPDISVQLNDLKDRFRNLDKSIDYRVGNAILKPYRFFKSMVTGKKFLV